MVGHVDVEQEHNGDGMGEMWLEGEEDKEKWGEKKYRWTAHILGMDRRMHAAHNLLEDGDKIDLETVVHQTEFRGIRGATP